MKLGLSNLVRARPKRGFIAALKFNAIRASQYIAMIFRGD